ncbi:MAG: hypothetical protein IKS33_05820 [Bacteroidales bacterium]|nr:hypothetical protein [Bacteroidales bacterium]MBQ4477114.1 hypothetical protein [Bacteroidales bacterium]MBR4453757.1 hypothetical protein [Bacteroidales bacterium]
MNKVNHFLSFSGIIVLMACLFTTNAQQTSVYDNFDASSVKSNEKYTWNYNPIEFDQSILSACITEVMNLARKTYNYADALVEKDALTDAAVIQSEYMAKVEDRTHDNVVTALKTPGQRAASTGATKRVTELITRVKATKGIEDYTYYDVAYEVVMSLLKNQKTSPTLLDKQYLYVGIGCNVDFYNKYCYVSIVMGNDLSFNRGEVSYKNTTYTRKTYGLKPYDEKICRKCEVRNVALLQKYIEVKGTDIYFNHPNVKDLKKIISKDEDGLAIDIVQHSQFPCNSSSNDVDYNYPNRGVMFKYMTFPQMLKKNENGDSKDKSLRVYMGSVPSNVSAPFDVNLIIIKEKSICKTVVKTNVRTPAINYKAKTSLIPDLNGISTTINYRLEAEKTHFEFDVPFEQSKSQYDARDIQPFINALEESKFDVDKIYITAYTSLEGGDKANAALQKKRSESIANAISQIQSRTIPYEIQYNDGWDLFVKDVPSQYKYLAEGTKNEAKAALKNAKTKKDLEPILAKHRFAHIQMDATYDVSETHVQDYLAHKFNRCIASGDYAMAFAIQKYMIKQVEDGVFTRKKYIQNLVIPENAKMLPFLTNKYYMLSFFGLTDADKQKIIDLAKLDPKNSICEFNALCCNIETFEISNTGQISSQQSKIDKFYNNAVGKQNAGKVDALNIAFQYKVLDFINSSETPDEALMETTYEKIKTVALPTITDWKKAYEVAASFIAYGDYDFARSAMDPYIEDKDVSEDFIFTYLNLYSLDENNYTSKKFEIACRLAAQKNRSRFCTEIKDYSYLIRENFEAKNIICNECK